MTDGGASIFAGRASIQDVMQTTTGDYTDFLGETYYRISNSEQRPPFLMSLVSSSDHWLFIASNGGLTAGRTNADSALFPYETEDKVAAHSEGTGGSARSHRGGA